MSEVLLHSSEKKKQIKLQKNECSAQQRNSVLTMNK